MGVYGSERDHARTAMAEESDELNDLIQHALVRELIHGYVIDDDVVTLEIGNVRLALRSEQAEALLRRIVRSDYRLGGTRGDA